uniref:Cyclic GMP-AMP synthase n=1 Tax=Cyanoderma ruficeps TaxID=181631 RepID=A0A8C3RGG3_9PASS
PIPSTRGPTGAAPSPACSPCRGRGRSARGGPTRPGPCSGSAPCSERRSGRTRGRAPSRCRRRTGCRTFPLGNDTGRSSAPPTASRDLPGSAPLATPWRPEAPAGASPAHPGHSRRYRWCRSCRPPPPPPRPHGPRRSPPPRSAALPPPRPRCPPGGARDEAPGAVLSRLSLGREDVSEAATLVNRVVSHLVQAIRGKESFFSSIERYSAGSYYERVKISEPNEFDIMLVMPVARIQLDQSDDTGAYYYVSFKRSPTEKGWLKFLEEDGKLSAFKMLEALREIIKQEVKNIKDVKVTVARKKAGSPAITLQIKNPPSEISVDIILTLKAQHSWPLSTQGGLKIEQWLGTKVRRDLRITPLYLVAKALSCIRNTWRLSFSHIEKLMIHNHGNSKTCCESDGPKCCRKGCLKLLKYLLEQLKMKYPKELEKFCSYHVKTAFLHSCVTWPNDSDWQSGCLDHCFQQCLEFFVDCLQKSQLTHFFIPQYNLFSLEDKARHHFLSRKISHELNNGFPVFHENY